MDRLIIERKLDSLQRCLARIRDKTPDDVAPLENDLDLQDVLVLNLSRAPCRFAWISPYIFSVNEGNRRRTPWVRPSTCSSVNKCWKPRWPNN